MLSSECRVFYLKLEADLHRYKLELIHYEYLEANILQKEFEANDHLEKLKNETKEIYLRACEDAEKLAPINKLRLGVFLNYSTFLAEFAEKVQDARYIAGKTFESALEMFVRMEDLE